MESETFFKRMRRMRTELEKQEQADIALFQELRDYFVDPAAYANGYTVETPGQAVGTLNHEGDTICEFSVVKGQINVTAAGDRSMKSFSELAPARDHITGLAAARELAAKKDQQRQQQEAMTMRHGPSLGKGGWMAS